MTFKQQLSEDYARDMIAEEAIKMALVDIERDLQSYNESNSLEKLGLPRPRFDGEPNLGIETMDIDGRVMDQTMSLEQSVSRLNEEQYSAYRTILCAITKPRYRGPTAFYLDGPGGCGKTFLYNVLIDAVESLGGYTVSAAYTGIASSLLRNGATIHKTYSVPVDGEYAYSLSISPTSAEAKRLKDAKLLIFDEATMIPLWMLRFIDKLLRDIMQRDSLFGGKVVVMGGDFRQCLPIVESNDRGLILAQCIRSASFWRRLKQLRLTRNMRARPDQAAFMDWLLSVGNGSLGTSVELPQSQVVDSEAELIRRVFGRFFGPHGAARLVQRSILAVRNSTVLRLNEMAINQFPGLARTYHSFDTLLTPPGIDPYAEITDELLHSLSPSGLPPHVLKLKVGCPVILVRNLNVAKGLCNGTRLIITRLCDKIVHARFPHGGDSFPIPYIPIIGKDRTLPYELQRVQLPIRLAFSVTINKAQGQTFDQVGLHLESPVFTHGQLYVGLSRARSLGSIHIYTGPVDITRSRMRSGQTPNIVFKEVLR
jgi:hypothetical protein